MKLLHYIRGIRKGKEINRLEKEAMIDPFLADALDGFDTVKCVDHEWRINEMRLMVLSGTKSGNRRMFRYLSIAASILLIVGSGWYFLSNKNKVDPPVYEQQIVENEKSISNDVSPKLPLQETEIQTDIALIVEKEADTKKMNKPTTVAQTRNDCNNETKLTDSVIIPDTSMIENEILAEAEEQDASSRMANAVSRGKEEKSEPVIGEKEYKKYLKANIIMPQVDDYKKKKGDVILKFTVNSKGRPTNIRIKKSLCSEADKEAIRLIEQGPDWTLSNEEVEFQLKIEN
jgi:TonB family protein